MGKGRTLGGRNAKQQDNREPRREQSEDAHERTRLLPDREQDQRLSPDDPAVSDGGKPQHHFI